MSTRARITLALTAGVVCGALTAWTHLERGSDFNLITLGASTWLAGGDPYTVRLGMFPMLYPFTAVLFGVPFVFLPYPDFWFLGLGVGLYVWAITGSQRHRFALLALVTPNMIELIRVVQWPPLLTAAALISPLGFLLACKPTIGAALWLAFLSRTALIGGLIFGLVSLALYPTWPWRWLETLSEARHMQAPVTFWGGPLLLLALLRWRTWEGRLLAAMACVPQTHFYYDAWPLWLIPQNGERAAWLTAAAWLMAIVKSTFWPTETFGYWSDRQIMGQLSVIFVYLPCLGMVIWPVKTKSRATAALSADDAGQVQEVPVPPAQ